MSLLVEDGTIVAGAESYLTVAEADAIIEGRGGSSDWDGLSLTNKEVQLRLATEYIDNKYNFIGTAVSSTQPLKWPRTGTSFDDTAIPDILKRAVSVLARDTVNTALYTTIVGTNAAGEIKSTYKKLDVLEQKTEYFSGGSASNQNEFTESKRILTQLLAPVNIGR